MGVILFRVKQRAPFRVAVLRYHDKALTISEEFAVAFHQTAAVKRVRPVVLTGFLAHGIISTVSPKMGKRPNSPGLGAFTAAPL